MEPHQIVDDRASSRQWISGGCKLYIYEGSDEPKAPELNRSERFHGWHWKDLPIFWNMALQNHPMRTRDYREADLFFIPFDQAKSGNFDSSFVRMNGNKSNHITVCHKPYRHCQGGAFRLENVSKLTYEVQDRYPWRLNKLISVPKGWYEIPRTQSFFEQQAYLIEDNLAYDERFRHKLIGSMFGRRTYSECGRLRTALENDCRNNEDTDASTGRQICSHSSTTKDTIGYMETYQDSVFSLQPIGDSYTRAAIWDSLVMGSIPIIFHRNSLLHLHSDIFRWDAQSDPIHVFIDIHDIIDRNVSVVEIIRKIPKDQIENLQNNIKRFIHRFSYFDFNHRHHIKDREKDSVDWVLEYFCNSILNVR